MFLRRSANLLKSTARFRGVLKHGFATTNKRINLGKIPRSLMLCAALIPATMLYYCAENSNV